MEGVIAKLEDLVVKLEQSGAHGASVGKVEILLFCPGPSVIGIIFVGYPQSVGRNTTGKCIRSVLHCPKLGETIRRRRRG